MPPNVVAGVALQYPDVLASPVLTQMSPVQGRVGTLVTLSGQRFGPTAAANIVRFNGVAAPVLSATATTLTVRVPATATTGPVQVVTGEGAGRSAQAFTVFQPPTLAVPAPAEGTPGSVLLLTRHGLFAAERAGHRAVQRGGGRGAAGHGHHPAGGGAGRRYHGQNQPQHAGRAGRKRAGLRGMVPALAGKLQPR